MADETTPPSARPKRTPEEIAAQREAMMAAKAAKASGQQPPAPPAAPAKQEEAPPPAAAPAPGQKRSPEEIRAQREAMMAAKAAKAAGPAVPATAPAPKPAAAPAPQPAAAPAPKPAAAPAPKPAAPGHKGKETPSAGIGPMNRREFMNYAWLSSIALLSAQTVAASLWFAFPNFKEGEFGGKFPIGPAMDVVPEKNAAPKAYTDGKFWLVNVEEYVDKWHPTDPKNGILAVYKVCTHLGCLYEWIEMTGRYECPCHGSKFSLTGDYIEGPAGRNLDRFVIEAYAPGSDRKAGTPRAITDLAAGEPLVVNGDDYLVIDTGAKILGKAR